MTSSQTPDRPTAAGVFVVRDPAVCAALERVLAPHRATAVAAPESNDMAEVLQERALRAETAAAHAERDLDATRQQLQDVVAELAAVKDFREAKATAQRDEKEFTQLRRQLEEARAEIAKLAARPDGRRPDGRRPTVSALRLKDQEAFAQLADRMDREALSQSKTVAGVLRTAAKSVRDEIAIVYGTPERKAS